MNDAVTCGLACLQGTLALGVIVGAVLILLTGSDRRTPWRIRGALIGLALWGVWLLWSAARGEPDSIAGQSMTALVAYVLLVYGRQIRGMLDGEIWWPRHKPKHARRHGHG